MRYNHHQPHALQTGEVSLVVNCKTVKKILGYRMLADKLIADGYLVPINKADATKYGQKLFLRSDIPKALLLYKKKNQQTFSVKPDTLVC